MAAVFQAQCSAHRAEVAPDGRDPPEPRCPRLARDPEADAGHRRVERVAPRREHAAKEKGRREGLAAGVRPHRIAVVDDVFHGREPERGERGVDDAVYDAVELAPEEVEDAEDGQPLHSLLDDRRRNARAHHLGELFSAEGAGDHLDARIHGGRDAARGDRAPAEHQRQRPPRLGIEAVDEPRDPEVDRERRQRAERAYPHRPVLARRVARLQRRHEKEQGEPRGSGEHEEHVEHRADGSAIALGVGAIREGGARERHRAAPSRYQARQILTIASQLSAISRAVHTPLSASLKRPVVSTTLKA